MKKLLLVDDHPIVRDGFIQILKEAFPTIKIDEAENGQEAISKVWKNDYDLLTLDISMPGRDGLSTLSQIKNIKPDLPILVLSMLPEELYGPRVFRAGASGYLEKTSSSGELITAIQKIQQGKKYMRSLLAEKLALSFVEEIESSPYERLSDQEFQVMRLIALGKTVEEIAEELSFSKKAIFKNRASIKSKMKMSNISEIICYAIEQGVVE
ncbi:MAG: response regulator transcription factor [Candidatus Aminicenantes bacterium]|nr:response regulator transcription factor [Candidatus Aminicenantes bacterium]